MTSTKSLNTAACIFEHLEEQRRKLPKIALNFLPPPWVAMKVGFSFATTTTAAAAAAALGAASTMLLASFSLVAVASAEHAHLPRRNKACHNMKNMIVKNCATTAKPPTKKPTAAVVKIPTTKPTKKPSMRPTRFPTVVPTHRPSTSVPSAGPTSSPSDGPTASPSGSPTSSPTAGCANLGVPVHFHSGHLYARVGHTEISWDNAKAAASSRTCCGAQGSLLVIGDAPERDFVSGTFNVSGQYGWIGLNDVVTEGTYVWTDGTTLDTSLFTPAPYYSTADGDDCGFYFYRSFDPRRWFTYRCDYILPFSIVEFDCSTAGKRL
jgi:Lectin C-type domain